MLTSPRVVVNSVEDALEGEDIESNFETDISAGNEKIFLVAARWLL